MKCRAAQGVPKTLFAMEQMGVAPDLTTFAKSIAGGFPLAGVTGRAEVMDAVAPGGLGGTYAVTRLPAWRRWKC